MEGKVSGVVHHDIFIGSREKMNINGVKEIVSFDEGAVNLKTVCGDLSVEGAGLHISVLNIEKGEVEMQGRINAVYYYDTAEDDKKGLLSRIFK